MSQPLEWAAGDESNLTAMIAGLTQPLLEQRALDIRSREKGRWLMVNFRIPNCGIHIVFLRTACKVNIQELPKICRG